MLRPDADPPILGRMKVRLRNGLLLLLPACCAFASAGCAGMQRTETAFQTQGNRICTRINTSPYLGTKARWDRDLRKTKAGLDELSRLRPPQRHRAAYQALLMAMRRIYVFDKAHERAEIALAQQGLRNDRRMRRGQKLKPFTGVAKRLVALTFRETGRDLTQRIRDSRTLGLSACNTVGTVSAIRTSQVAKVP